MVFIIGIALLILMGIIIFVFGFKDAFGKEINKINRPLELISIILFLTSWGIILFQFTFVNFSAEYYEAIDPSNMNYTPFAGKHIEVLKTYQVLGVFSMICLWVKNHQFPPLFLLVFVLLTTISFVLFVIMAIQVAYNYNNFYGHRYNYLLAFAYMVNALICLSVVCGFVRQELNLAKNRKFNNENLDSVNKFIVKTEVKWGKFFIFALPIVFLPMLILMLFGYEYNALTKVFTETATWTFSKETHPPFLDQQGHYLCTVAACGSPKIVKPIRLGVRHGNEIIVNRQLMIANAFEEKIEETFPKVHRWIRSVYDKYGYNLSKKITTPFGANLTYICMKPLECIFWGFLNLTDLTPQKRINSQYQITMYQQITIQKNKKSP